MAVLHIYPAQSQFENFTEHLACLVKRNIAQKHCLVSSSVVPNQPSLFRFSFSFKIVYTRFLDQTAKKPDRGGIYRYSCMEQVAQLELNR